MKNILVGLCTAPLAVIAAQGNDWISIGRNHAGMAYYVKASSAKIEDGGLSLWVKVVPSRPEPAFPEKPKGPRYVHALLMHHISCVNKTLGTSSVVKYDATGTVVWSSTVLPEMEPVVPDSMGERLVLIACGSRNP